MILHLSKFGSDNTLCGLDECRACPHGSMNVEDHPDQPAEGDDFIARYPQWKWCSECRKKVVSP